MDPGFFSHDRQPSPRKGANWLSLFTYWWLKELFTKGFRRKIDLDDVYAPLGSYESGVLGSKYQKLWDERGKDGSPSTLLKIILKIHGFRLMVVNIIFAVFFTLFRIAQPLCLGYLISYFSPGQTDISKDQAYLYASGVVLSMLLNVFVLHPCLTALVHIAMQARVGCCSLIYRKVLKLDLKADNPEQAGLSGRVINLMTNDVNRFDMCCAFLLELFRAPIEGGIVIYIMYTNIEYAGLIGVAFLLCFIPLQSWLGRLSANIRRKSAGMTDDRIRLMNEIIQGIQVIKMYAWEYSFGSVIRTARHKEMKLVKRVLWIRALIISCIKLNTRISIFLSIIVYILLGNQITASKIFVLYSLYDLLKMTVVEFFPMAFMAVLDAYVSIKRIQDFLLLPEVAKLTEERMDLYSDDRLYDSIRGIDNPDSLIGKNIKRFESELMRKQELDGHMNGRVKENLEAGDLGVGSEGSNTIKDKDGGVTMRNVNAVWKTEDVAGMEKKIIALENITLDVFAGELIAIIGPVGSGKSSLLHTILGEIHTEPGSKIDIYGSVSYCSQQPWLFEASIRQNILFGLDMDMQRYRQVVKCCQLERDLELLPHGDRTIVGERGVSLSGGQKARVSLARCVYRQSDLYLLDDPLSAVDTHVSKALFETCMKGFLRDAAVILVTHQVQQLVNADKIYLMEAGKIVFQGTYDQLQHSQFNFSTLIPSDASKDGNDDKESDLSSQNNPDQLPIKPGRTSLHTSDYQEHEKQVREAEIQEAGSVDLGVYTFYIKSGGGAFGLTVLAVLFILGQAAFSISDLWISYWVNLEEMESLKPNNTNNFHFNQHIPSPTTYFKSTFLPFLPHIIMDNSLNLTNNARSLTDENFNPYGLFLEVMDLVRGALGDNRWNLSRETCIIIYSSLVLASIVLIFSKLLIFFGMCIRSSVNLHDSMFKGISRATMWFFNNNASGRILNRFSKDIGTVDIMLPPALVDCLHFLTETVGILVVVCVVNYWLLIPTAIVVVLLYLMRMVYINTARSIKRLEGICRSPAFTHVNATLSGLETIRASEGAAEILTVEFDRHQDLHSSVWTLVINGSRGFAFWMDILCCLYLAIVTYSFLVFTDGDTFGGKVGLAMTQVMGLVMMCQTGMRQTAEVENQMTSVERINEYSNLPPEPTLETDKSTFTQKYPKTELTCWPEKGSIKLQNVYLQYDKGEDAEYILKDVTFCVQSGEKVGIVGRTGAGKSSIIAALYRLTETEGLITIDGVDTKDVGLHDLRCGMSIIPQEPVLFSGTLRDNLDLLGKYKDQDLWSALEEVGLKYLVSELAGGLSCRISDGGSNLSVGQRQLLCLARAALRGAKILLMDEATANVDHETDQLIQKTIRRKFFDRTVITIAHRLHTVMDSDKVVVMDSGRVVEMGHPFELLNIQSASSIIEDKKQVEYEGHGGMFKTLAMQAGPQTYNMLYNMAQKSYEKMQENQRKTYL